MTSPAIETKNIGELIEFQVQFMTMMLNVAGSFSAGTTLAALGSLPPSSAAAAATVGDACLRAGSVSGGEGGEPIIVQARIPHATVSATAIGTLDVRVDE